MKAPTRISPTFTLALACPENPVMTAISVAATWQKPAKYDDGSLLPRNQIKQYELQQGTSPSPGVFGTVKVNRVLSNTTMTTTFAALESGAHAFRGRVVAINGEASPWSKVATATIASSGDGGSINLTYP